MSNEYGDYIKTHRKNVEAAFLWLEGNYHDLCDTEHEWNQVFVLIKNHDMSKCQPDEYGPYYVYFYGKEQPPSPDTEMRFRYAWSTHIHRNGHHWQHWVYHEDDTGESMVLEMPKKYAIEMFCDWWSFSWQKNEPLEICRWYLGHKAFMLIHPKTTVIIEKILEHVVDAFAPDRFHALGLSWRQVGDLLQKERATG